jgi:hypothetical protein
VFANAIFLPQLRAVAIFLAQLRAVAIFLSQLRATAAQFFAITGHSAIAVTPQLRRILTAIQNMGPFARYLFWIVTEMVG